MRPPVRGIKKSAVQPVIITNENKFTPKISERTIRRKQKARERKLNPGICTNTLSACGVVCLYVFLVLCIVIGAGGIAVSIIFFDADSTTQGWKIVGIALGAATCIIGLILILLSIFKQTRNRSWRAEKKETLVTEENYSTEDVDELSIEDRNNNELENNANRNVKEESHTRETASSPIDNSLYAPLNQPGQLSIAIQTEEHMMLKSKPHTTIDRSKKYSTTTETQTNSKTNTPDSVIFRRVPIPTAKVIIQQPTTKVMIVRVPNTAGELILQPKDIITNGK